MTKSKAATKVFIIELQLQMKLEVAPRTYFDQLLKSLLEHQLFIVQIGERSAWMGLPALIEILKFQFKRACCSMSIGEMSC